LKSPKFRILFKNNGETKSQQMHFQKSSNILPYSA
jgi:hypothetical protein